ncbi:MAG: hypothetical protein ABMA00_14340, partial [Gemmatimonas sp.]
MIALLACTPGPSGPGRAPPQISGSHPQISSTHVEAPPAAPSVARSTLLYGASYDMLGRYMNFLPDLDGDGKDELFAERLTDAGEVCDEGIATRWLVDPVGRGDHELTSADVRASFCGGGLQAAAGDTDGDGYQDLWYGSQLFRGPFSGMIAVSDAVAQVQLEGGWPIGNFDADGDGILDAAFGGYTSNLVVAYGPFDGDRWAGTSLDH